MDKLRVFSKKLGTPILVGEGAVGGTISDKKLSMFAASWTNGGWNNDYGQWINGGWNNDYGRWINGGWNNDYGQWTNGGWNNDYGRWANSGWNNSGGK